MKNLILLVIWAVLSLFIIGQSTELISAPSTIKVVSGIFILTAWLMLTLKTSCLTNIKIKRKNGK